jgi:hypothetical protein
MYVERDSSTLYLSLDIGLQITFCNWISSMQ